VGLPRESKISRAWTRSILAIRDISFQAEV
jgi:hypothetical protein